MYAKEQELATAKEEETKMVKQLEFAQKELAAEGGKQTRLLLERTMNADDRAARLQDYNHVDRADAKKACSKIGSKYSLLIGRQVRSGNTSKLSPSKEALFRKKTLQNRNLRK